MHKPARSQFVYALTQHLRRDQHDSTFRDLEPEPISFGIQACFEAVRQDAALVDYSAPQAHVASDAHARQHNRIFDDGALLGPHVREQQRITNSSPADDAAARDQGIGRLAGAIRAAQNELRGRPLFLQSANRPGFVVHVQFWLHPHQIQIRSPECIYCADIPPIDVGT